MGYKISLPFYSIVPFVVMISMGWACLEIFDALRYTHCNSWMSLGTPSQEGIHLFVSDIGNPYVETGDGVVYCRRQNQWAPCQPPTQAPQPKIASDWIKSRFQVMPGVTGAVDLQRVTHPLVLEIEYYALLDSGQVWTCPTQFSKEVEQIVHLPVALWLLLPVGLGLWSAVSLFQIFVEKGQPVEWDFFGRGRDY
jgi:hypothetical protein